MKYLKRKMSRGFLAIYSGRTILRMSGGLLGLFLPIFLYSLFDFNIKYVFYYYLLMHLTYVLVVPWGAKYLNKIGLRKSLKISILFGASFYFFFFLIDNIVVDGSWRGAESKVLLLLLLAYLGQSIQRVLYWIPLHTDLAKFTNFKNRGKQLSMLESTNILAQSLLPLLAGWILTKYNYNILFVVVVFIFLFSLIPFSFLPKTREHFSWSYLKSWKEFLSKKRRRVVLAYWGNGAEDVIGIVIWPIFIWELLEGSYFDVGALTSIIVLLTIFLQLIAGSLSDKFDKNKMIKYGNYLYAIGWLVKIFIGTAFQIFIAATYHNLTKIFSRTPFDVLTYEKAADQGHFVDEFTVIHEMAFHLGKTSMLLVSLLLVSFMGIQWTFILAALASVAMNYLIDDDLIQKGRHVG